MSEMVDLNINEEVMVRLTDYGRQLLHENHAKLQQFAINCGARGFPYDPPEEDANGWSKWQLWRLMLELGRACVMGAPPPFETTIRISLKEGAGASQNNP